MNNQQLKDEFTYTPRRLLRKRRMKKWEELNKKVQGANVVVKGVNQRKESANGLREEER